MTFVKSVKGNQVDETPRHGTGRLRLNLDLLGNQEEENAQELKSQLEVLGSVHP